MTEKMIPRFSVVKAIQVVGDAWLLKILARIYRGERRFVELQAALGIPKGALTSRLDQMVQDGILRRVPINGTKRYEYRLDEAGLDLWEVLLAIREWSLKWSPDRLHARDIMIHEDCGQEAHPILCCSSCAGPLTPFNTFAKSGPGAGMDARPTPVARRRGAAALRTADDGNAEDATMLIFGDRWTPAIIATCFRGLSRFSEIQAYLLIPPMILSGRLNELVELGVLRRRSVADGQGPEEVRLTRKGLDIFPYISMLAKWGDRWLSDEHGVPLTFHHNDCGCQYTPVFRCSNCNQPLRRSRIRLVQSKHDETIEAAAASVGKP